MPMLQRENSAGWWLRWRFRVALWWAARLMPLRVKRKALGDILDWIDRDCAEVCYIGLSAPYIESCVLRSTRRPWLMRDRRCLRIGLLGYRFLRKAGFAPELHFGVSPDSMAQERIKAHCWVCLAGHAIVGAPLPGMVTIYVHKKHENSREKMNEALHV